MTVKEIKCKIADAILDAHKRDITITGIRMSLEDERTLAAESTAADVGDVLLSNIILAGVRRALPAIYGYPVFWGKSETKLELAGIIYEA